MYKTPRWDIHKAAWKNHQPNRRFAIYSFPTAIGPEDLVLDKETGFVWERSPATDKRTWDTAIVFAMSATRGGRRGWRLPTIEELLSLNDPGRSNPALPSGHPFLGLQLDEFYWSCTLGMTSPPTYAWGTRFDDGSTSNCLKSSIFCSWLIRGDSGHDYPY